MVLRRGRKDGWLSCLMGSSAHVTWQPYRASWPLCGTCLIGRFLSKIGKIDGKMEAAFYCLWQAGREDGELADVQLNPDLLSKNCHGTGSLSGPRSKRPSEQPEKMSWPCWVSLAAFPSHLTSSQVRVWSAAWPHLPARHFGLQLPEKAGAWWCTVLTDFGMVGASAERRHASALECWVWTTSYLWPGSASVAHGNEGKADVITTSPAMLSWRLFGLEAALWVANAFL